MNSGKLYTWGVGSDYFGNKDILKIESASIGEGYGFLKAANNDIYFWGENSNIIDTSDIVVYLSKVPSLSGI